MKGNNGSTAAGVTVKPMEASASHLPSTAEALEVIIRALLRKGVLTRDELLHELELLKTTKI